MRSKNIKKPRATKRTNKELTATTKKVNPPPASFPNTPLSSINIAKILSSFLTFRSSVKELSQSIQKIEGMMDSAFQMFEMATRMFQQNRGNMFPPLPPGQRPFPSLNARNQQNHRPFDFFEDEEIPVIDLPEPRERFPSSRNTPSLSNINFQQILSLISSPLIQRFISQMFKPKSVPTISQGPSKKKRG